jgi:hypothetical protein
MTSAFSYSEDLADKLYSMDDPRLEDPEAAADQKAYTRLFFEYLCRALENGKPLIELPYNPYLAWLLSLFIDHAGKEDGAKFLVVSFFHSDKDLQKRLGQNAGLAINMQLITLKAMLNDPLIKKIEIPIDAVITDAFMKGLMQENG